MLLPLLYAWLASSTYNKKNKLNVFAYRNVWRGPSAYKFATSFSSAVLARTKCSIADLGWSWGCTFAHCVIRPLGDVRPTMTVVSNTGTAQRRCADAPWELFEPLKLCSVAHDYVCKISQHSFPQSRDQPRGQRNGGMTETESTLFHSWDWLLTCSRSRNDWFFFHLFNRCVGLLPNLT